MLCLSYVHDTDTDTHITGTDTHSSQIPQFLMGCGILAKTYASHGKQQRVKELSAKASV